MKISIIIPVYNKVKYLKTILNQVRAQTFTDYECLLIDDGSNDGSEIICDEYREMDSRFKVIHISNRGVSNARNLGLTNCIGEYITFIDADDEIKSTYIENLYECISKVDADIVISGYSKFWDYNDNIVNVNHPYIVGLTNMNDFIVDFANVQKNTGLFGCCASKIFKRVLCQGVKFDANISLAEDFDFYLKLYNKVDTIYFDDKCLYMYRQEAVNSSAIIEDESIDYFTQLQINLRYKQFLISKCAFCGDNKTIVEEKLANYLYLSLFHCPENLMDSCLLDIKRAKQMYGINHVCGNSFQKIILWMLKNEFYNSAKLMILTYRYLRNLIRGK